MRSIQIREEPIELCQLLKFAGLAASGGEAKAMIAAGRVELDGRIETQKRKQVKAGARVTCGGETVVVQVGGSRD